MPDVLNNDDLNALAAEYVLGTLDYEERKGATSLQEVDHAFCGLVRIWERRFGELHLMVEPVEPDGKVWERIKGKLGEQVPAAVFALENIPPASEETPVVPAESAAEGVPKIAPAEGTDSEREAQAPSISPAVEMPPADATAKLMRELEEASKLIAPQPPAPLTTVTPPRRLIERDVVVSGDDAAVTPRPVRRWRLFAAMMSLVAIALAGLIGAWRFAPDLLPQQLSANALLHLTSGPKAPPPLPPKRKSRPPEFDE